MKILISPYSKYLRNGAVNPKNYPYWEELVSKLKNRGHEIIQIGVANEKKLVEDCRFNMTLPQLEDLLKECDLFISVDNFIPHMAHYIGAGQGIVLFGQSDPNIFGYPENINLLRDRKHLREKQFDMWEAVGFNPDVFVYPDIVMSNLENNKWVSGGKKE